MRDLTLWPQLLAMLLAGLAGSLHCMGMCGPILAGFAQAFSKGRTRSLRRDFIGYHFGRVWMYSLLGFGAGLGAVHLRRGAAWVHWQQSVSLGTGLMVILCGMGLAGWLRWGGRRQTNRCETFRGVPGRWFHGLLRARGIWPRVILGAIMGLLPCGLVYAMLALAASLPNPGYSALGMALFGLGTVPSLSVVLGITRLASQTTFMDRLRRHGSTLAAILLILSGGWMIYRGQMSPQHPCAHCATDTVKPSV